MVRPSSGTGERALWQDRDADISYASCNEDSSCELRALEPGPGKRVVAITAGGGRVLDLLEANPDEVWAVDLNPAQNHLLELKIAGIQQLEHGPFLSFLGIRPNHASCDRWATYTQLRARLTAEARHYFDARPRAIQDGILYQGHLERFLGHVIAPLVRCLRPFWVRRLMAARQLDEQRALLHGPSERVWQAVLGTFCRRRFLDWFSGEAGFWRYIPPDVPMHTRLLAGIFGYLDQHLARDNHLLSLIFCGRYINEAALPAYLRPEPFARIRAALGRTRLRLLTGALGDVLRAAPDASLDAFSLSDISSYLDDLAFHSLFDQVLRTGRKGARICSRGILHHRELPAEHARRVRRDRVLEETFARDDASMVHAFLVGELT
jgi:S-adenosylmethionine-diacylglycerol 3-amino-3-carboxypropyl transferase